MRDTNNTIERNQPAFCSASSLTPWMVIRRQKETRNLELSRISFSCTFIGFQVRYTAKHIHTTHSSVINNFLFAKAKEKPTNKSIKQGQNTPYEYCG